MELKIDTKSWLSLESANALIGYTKLTASEPGDIEATTLDNVVYGENDEPISYLLLNNINP